MVPSFVEAIFFSDPLIVTGYTVFGASPFNEILYLPFSFIVKLICCSLKQAIESVIFLPDLLLNDKNLLS